MCARAYDAVWTDMQVLTFWWSLGLPSCSPRRVNYPEDGGSKLLQNHIYEQICMDHIPEDRTPHFSNKSILLKLINWSSCKTNLSGYLLYLHLCEFSKFHVNLIILRYIFSLKNHPQMLAFLCWHQENTFGWFWKEWTVMKWAAVLLAIFVEPDRTK